MRTTTYFRHKTELDRRALKDDIREVANVANILLKPPEFIQIAKVRLDSLKEQLARKGDDAALNSLDLYLGGVLEANVAAPIFRTLFGGDLRRNLELFEYAVASPHMVHTDAYYYTERERKPKAASDYVRRHRLLTALMLGPWETFRQQRSLVFLNVYNAQLKLEAKDKWRNTLLIPRMLHLLNVSGHNGISGALLIDAMRDHLRYTSDQVLSVLTLLSHYRLIQSADSENAPTLPLDPSQSLELTACGKFYITGDHEDSGLMHKLEYIQAIYWDTHIPRTLYFDEFRTVMETKHLDGFVASFCDFLRFEEAQESDVLHAFSGGDEPIRRLESVAEKVASVAHDQVWRIYRSATQR